MKVVLIRHAVRPVHTFGDTSLSAEGHAQAEALVEAVTTHGRLPRPTRLLASPKKRAQETLSPLARHFQGLASYRVDERLDERRQGESAKEFERRVLGLLRELEETQRSNPGSHCLYLCSHMDWLELASILIPTSKATMELNPVWRNCETRVFTISEGLWTPL